MMKKILAFTLSEIMIALAVLGVLIATVTPIVANIMPNQNKIMMKKAYYTTAEVVSEMINNATLYPVMDSAGNVYNGSGAAGPLRNMEAVSYSGITASGDTKFGNIFLRMINSGDIEDVSSSATDNAVLFLRNINAKSVYKTSTKDGMIWYILNDGSMPHVANILVDVNGSKAPNCSQLNANICNNRNDNFDQFVMDVYFDGTISFTKTNSGGATLEQTWATEAIGVSSSLSNND